MNWKASAAAGFAAAFALVAGAHAQETAGKHAGLVVLNLRATNVSPVGSDPIVTAAGAATGLGAKVDDFTAPTLGLTWFFTDNLAVEVIAGTTRHTVRAVGGATNAEVHKEWVLPPVVALQYHFAPQGRVSPYVGAGANAMLFYSGKDLNGYRVKLDDGLGLALQGGVDVALSGPWSLNLDVKKVFFKTDASINGGALAATVHLDPWVLSAGFGRRF